MANASKICCCGIAAATGEKSTNKARTVNERGLRERFNLQSSYALPSGQRLVVVTNAERTLTMVHLDQHAE